MINCHANQGVGVKLLEIVQGLAPAPDAQALLWLEVHAEEDLELPLVWLIATIFQSMWKLRETKNKVEPYLVRAELEAKVNMLRETRFNTKVAKLEEFTATIFR